MRALSAIFKEGDAKNANASTSDFVGDTLCADYGDEWYRAGFRDSKLVIWPRRSMLTHNKPEFR